MNLALPAERNRWLALAVGALALLGCIVLGFASPRDALLSYLFAFLFFTGLSVGSLALELVHALTGGAWGVWLRPQLRAAARTLPLQALLALPILFGLHALYAWADAGVLAEDALLRAQTWYLNSSGFVIRTVAYFALWLLLAREVERRLDDPVRLPRIAAAGLVVYALTATLAAVDWAMSLLPHWHSTSFGMMVATGWMLAAAALATLRVAFGAQPGGLAPPKVLHDLGSLLLMFVLAWSYLAFMQFLTVWIADLPSETSWYIPRMLSGWRGLGWFLITFHFAVPFALLLSRRAKRHRAWLAGIAAMLLIANLADALWLVEPGLRGGELVLRATDFLAPIGVGGLWTFVFVGQLRADRAGDGKDGRTASRAATEAAHG